MLWRFSWRTDRPCFSCSSTMTMSMLIKGKLKVPERHSGEVLFLWGWFRSNWFLLISRLCSVVSSLKAKGPETVFNVRWVSKPLRTNYTIISQTAATSAWETLVLWYWSGQSSVVWKFPEKPFSFVCGLVLTGRLSIPWTISSHYTENTTTASSALSTN